MENIKDYFGGFEDKDRKHEHFERKEIDFRHEGEWDEQEKAAIRIIEKIQEAGFQAYFAGGAVRDYIKGKKPNDIDICTSASSREVKEIFEKGSDSTVYYKSEKAQENKIINIKTGAFDFEVASFRKDIFLAEDMSERLKTIEAAGYSKRLIEYDNDYDDFLNGLEDGDRCELLNEDAIKNILSDRGSILPTEKEGVYRIEDGDQKYSVLFYRIISDVIDKDSDESGDAIGSEKENVAETGKKQKHVAGRHPDLTITKGVKLEEDARRRDFTMNGLFLDPKQEKIIDCVGGYDDVINKKIKFIGDPMERIREDKIRILRFFRFKGVMGLNVDDDSINAIRNWFSDEGRQKEFMDMFYLNQRIKPELEKILKSENTSAILDDMMNEGILELIMPEIAKMKGVEQPKEHHEEGDVWEHTKKCLDELISLDDYKNKYPRYDLQKIEQDYLAFPGNGHKDLLSFEDYADECMKKNIKADDARYFRIKNNWNGRMPSKEEYVEEFARKYPRDVEREYLELVWSVLLHDSGKVESQTIAKETGSEAINFHNHEKASTDISKYILLIEKEAKQGRLRGLNLKAENLKGLNSKGERLKGLNYELDFAGNVLWLVSNHMHHLDFSRMSRTKQEQLMGSGNFDKLLELWRADVMGSRPLRTEHYDDAVKIYEAYKVAKKEKKSEDGKEEIIKPDELIRILQGEDLEMKGGLLKFGNYSFSRAIPVIIDYLENALSGDESAEQKVKSLVRKEKAFDKIKELVDKDGEISKIKKEMENVSGKNRTGQLKKMEARIGKRANEIFDAYFEKLSQKGADKVMQDKN